jgi:hypothetical protein
MSDLLKKIDIVLSKQPTEILNEELLNEATGDLALITKVFDQPNTTFPDQITRNGKGHIVFRKGFFYTHGKTYKDFESSIENDLKKAGVNYTLVDSGQVDKSFRGGASLANSSHWYVIIKVNSTQLNEDNDSLKYSKTSYGLRWRQFTGKEGRLTLKEKYFKDKKSFEKFKAKIQEDGNFYEIDSISYPEEEVNECLNESKGDVSVECEKCGWGATMDKGDVPALCPNCGKAIKKPINESKEKWYKGFPGGSEEFDDALTVDGKKVGRSLGYEDEIKASVFPDGSWGVYHTGSNSHRRVVKGNESNINKAKAKAIEAMHKYETKLEKDGMTLTEHRLYESKEEYNVPDTNIYITGFGRDVNGNTTIKVNTPNERSRSLSVGDVFGGKNVKNEYWKDEADAKVFNKMLIDYIEKHVKGMRLIKHKNLNESLLNEAKDINNKSELHDILMSILRFSKDNLSPTDHNTTLEHIKSIKMMFGNYSGIK